MGAINEAWHRRHPMAPNPTMDQRVAWHTAHAKACACREIPPSVKAHMAKSGPK